MLWEESLSLLADYIESWQSLPRKLARDVAKEVGRADTTVLAPWELAGDGWRQYIKDRQEAHAYERNYAYPGSKSTNIERFFRESLGLSENPGCLA
jgi:hypothetical protein